MGRKSTKEKILEAAYFLFSEKGYTATTTREIAQKASVSEVTLFRIFGNKENLFEEVLKVNSVIPNLKEIVLEAQHKNLKELLNHIAQNFYFALVQKKKMIKIAFSEVNQYSDKVIFIYKRLTDEIDSLLIEIFSTKQKEIDANKLKSNAIAMVFRGMIFDLFLENEIFALKEYSDTNIRNILSEFIEIFLDGIKK